MREIKFRGKRIGTSEWVYGDLIHRQIWSEAFPVIRMQDDGFDIYEECEVISETVGQYTGLKDKHGVETYEGDIVAFEDSDGGYEYQDLVMNTGIVEYGELRFYFTNRVAVEMGDFYIKDGRCDDIEVIGNIHDNPELLEGE